MTGKREGWDEVRGFMESEGVTFGPYLSYWFEKTPRRALHYASYYKFAARMIGGGRRVLDLGCSEGLGTWMLAKECGFARGVDLEERAVAVAKENWRDGIVEFVHADFFRLPPEPFDGVVSFDVIEHFERSRAGSFLETVTANLGHDGTAVIGTPSREGQAFASAVSKEGHLHVYSSEELESLMREHFHHVFIFGANDEVVHTGFPRMVHYLVAIGCRKRREPRTAGLPGSAAGAGGKKGGA